MIDRRKFLNILGVGAVLATVPVLSVTSKPKSNVTIKYSKTVSIKTLEPMLHIQKYVNMEMVSDVSINMLGFYNMKMIYGDDVVMDQLIDIISSELDYQLTQDEYKTMFMLTRDYKYIDA